ncbi:glycine--tRNA ligase subunit alpha [Blochmannia endosymbiont of Camponotus (Colobopsis) obliquus]|uniref:glycine--tRNA ligase subunit alpha n=1 Tax=Blochmannia endosymbiont of Camponotus (Colobopsis) obliquus TaxID=1505597 RepID=UPI00061A8ACA|nr:glycine--tRNA ligase subunit alpha [Blochmannia endosymbiont of Camponotus (Colobopsis) obliquus]AKC60204.1 Glycine--tRNA ligase alpha subuni [Blochmannia endosymbiont of Camponotus (Colobopsis) obliquus]
MRKIDIKTLHGLILILQEYWSNNGCVIVQPLDLEVGAGTSHPMTFLRAIGPEPFSAAYVQCSRRPSDGRYGKNLNRLQQFYQFQVVVKPSPQNMQELYLKSLQNIGLDISMNDICFIEDNWQNPTLGAWGLGWEVRWNGMEITQFTYFQQVGGLECHPVTGEITYGLERLSMIIQELDNVYNIVWGNSVLGQITYGDLFYLNEIEQSLYNFEYSDVGFLFGFFEKYEHEAARLMELNTPLLIPAYEYLLKAMHIFNLLDARKVISSTERQNYVLRIYSITKRIAMAYYVYRESLGFPMCNNTLKYQML